LRMLFLDRSFGPWMDDAHAVEVAKWCAAEACTLFSRAQTIRAGDDAGPS
jgi:hypothetical protein